MIDIVKLVNGNVALYDTASGDFLSSLSPDIVEIQCNINGTVKVIQDNGNVEYFDPANISNTQVLPAAAIAFTGNCADLALLLSTDFFFVVSGGGGSQDLASVLVVGNTSGANDIEFDAGQGLYFANASRLREGTIDAGLGGLKGIAEICGAGYESKWEGGVRYIMGSSGNTIRQSLYNFANTPTVTDDTTKGYAVGSLWTLDNGTVYVCSDATTGAAVWALKLIVNADVDASAAIAISKLAPLPVVIQLAASDETTALTTGTAKVTFRMPHAMTLTSVRASLTTAQASGSIFTVDINESGASILSTKLTIDNTEKTSTTAATPAVISDTALADDAEITIDIDQIGNGSATGLKITLIGTR
jgi:hypothetical protein